MKFRVLIRYLPFEPLVLYTLTFLAGVSIQLIRHTSIPATETRQMLVVPKDVHYA